MNPVIREDMECIYASGIDWDRFRDRQVLIAGAGGMLPSYMALALLYVAEKHPRLQLKVNALVRDREKACRHFADYLDGGALRVITGDVTEPVSIQGKLDYIIHGASPATSREIGAAPVSVLLPNTVGTYRLLELARENAVEGFLYFSTDQVYGYVAGDRSIREDDMGQLDPLDVRSCYGESKRMGENMCKCWFAQYGIHTRIVRPSHTYGPTLQLGVDSRVFAGFIDDIVHNRDIVMRSAGDASLSFCYLVDGTVGYFKALLDGADGEAYNVTNPGCHIKIKELAQRLVAMYPEKNLAVRVQAHSNSSKYIVNQKLNQNPMDVTKLSSLGWVPRYSLEEGFRRTIDSFATVGEM